MNESTVSSKAVKVYFFREFLINNFSTFFVPTVVRENVVKHWENERDNVTESETTSQAFEIITPGNADIRRSTSERIIEGFQTNSNGDHKAKKANKILNQKSAKSKFYFTNIFY